MKVDRRIKHGLHASKEYKIWDSMVRRCHNKNHAAWEHYGGRGIAVCDRWRTFTNFYADMCPKPAGLQLDRIDNDKGYFKENCRWATVSEQAKNRRSTVILTYLGESKCISEWAKEFNLNRSLITKRLKAGWPVKEALTLKPVPPKLRRSLSFQKTSNMSPQQKQT